MHDDESMDRLLRSAMAAEVPQPSSGFEAAVMRRVRPRRLSRSGRAIMAAYGVAAAAATVWLLRGLDPTAIGLGVAASLATVGGAGVYVQRLVIRA